MPNINYQLYRRQFYIGINEKKINENWASLQLKCGLILSYCTTLPVKTVLDTKGKQWILIGDAIQSLEDQNSPEDCLAHFDYKTSIENLYHSWAGRWVLIGEDTLHLNASGLLGCFYSLLKGSLEIASVPGFIVNKIKPEIYDINYGVGIDWYVTPDSGFKNVSKLLPSQFLNLSTGNLTPRKLECELPKLTYDETIKYLSKVLNTTLKNIYQIKRLNIVLALTGGYDSRLLMASLNKSKIPYTAITFDYPTIKPADKSIPKRLSKISGIDYKLIRRRKPKIENLNKYFEHSNWHAVERDKEYMLYQQMNDLEGNNTLLIRAGCFEVASSKRRTKLPENIIDGKSINNVFQGNDYQAESHEKWVNWIRNTTQTKVDWRDRYYWEQRISGWLSCTEQALDLVNIECFVPANSFLFFNLMLSIHEPIRLKKIHQVDMIKHLSPELLSVPFNSKMNFIYRRYYKILLKIEQKRKRKYNY